MKERLVFYVIGRLVVGLGTLFICSVVFLSSGFYNVLLYWNSMCVSHTRIHCHMK